MDECFDGKIHPGIVKITDKLTISHLYRLITAAGGQGSEAEKMLSKQQHPPVRIHTGIFHNTIAHLRYITRLYPPTEHDIRSVGVWLHIYNQHATYSIMPLCPSSTLQAPQSMPHILEGKKEKEHLGWADVYGFQFLDPLETILKSKIHAVHYTCYPSKVLTSC